LKGPAQLGLAYLASTQSWLTDADEPAGWQASYLILFCQSGFMLRGLQYAKVELMGWVNIEI